MNQTKLNKLRSLGYVGSIDMMYLAWLLANGATTSNLEKAEKEFLASKGFAVGNVNDDWKSYLRSLLYTGSRNDMEYSFWVNL